MVSWDLFQEAFLTNTQTGYVKYVLKKNIVFFTCSNDVHPFGVKQEVFHAISLIMVVDYFNSSR